MRKFAIAIISVLLGVGQFALFGIGFGGVALADGCPYVAGSTGLRAEIIAAPGQHITGTVDASNCDIGVYIGPGVKNVTIDGATITGAIYHGILAQDTSNVTIQNSTVSNNAQQGESQDFPETKAIQLDGTSSSVIQNNIVENNGGGGIAVLDDGPLSPGTPNPGQLLPGNNNRILNNQVMYNYNGCGIVVAAYNPGGGVNNNVVSGNTVGYNPAGIVIAADEPNTIVTGNRVSFNIVYGSPYADVVVHSNEAGDIVTNTMIYFNQIGSSESEGPGLGIIVGAEVPNAAVLNTVIMENQITNEQIGIATNNAKSLWPFLNRFNNVEQRFGQEPIDS